MVFEPRYEPELSKQEYCVFDHDLPRDRALQAHRDVQIVATHLYSRVEIDAWSASCFGRLYFHVMSPSQSINYVRGWISPTAGFFGYRVNECKSSALIHYRTHTVRVDGYVGRSIGEWVGSM